jgi:hypothetical protein
MAGELDLSTVEIDGAPTLATAADVDALEDFLGVSLPAGYREYVTTLGEGGLDSLVRVLPPWRVRAQLEEHRSRMAGYWFWGDGVESFGQDEAMVSLPIADTMDGDAVAWSPADPSRLFILPRDDDRIVPLPSNILEVAEWICAGGLGHPAAERHSFQPWDSRTIDPTERTSPRPAVVAPDAPAPDLARPPRDVLLAYFAELAEVEAWAATTFGSDPDQFRPDGHVDELMARTEAVAARYGTVLFARGQRGASVAMTATPPHAASGIRILDETEVRPGCVRIKAAHGTDWPEANEYVLERSSDEWRIASMRPDFDYRPHA